MKWGNYYSNPSFSFMYIATIIQEVNVSWIAKVWYRSLNHSYIPIRWLRVMELKSGMLLQKYVMSEWIVTAVDGNRWLLNWEEWGWGAVGRGWGFKNASELLNLWPFTFSRAIKCISFNVWVRYFVLNFNSMGTFEILHKLSYPCTERCNFHAILKF